MPNQLRQPKNQVRQPKHQVRQPKHQVRQPKHQVRQPKHQVRQPKHQVRTALLLPKLTASVKLQSTESSRVTGSFHVRFFPFIQNLQVALCHLCQQGRLSGDQEAEGAGASLPFLLLILLMQLKYKM